MVTSEMVINRDSSRLIVLLLWGFALVQITLNTQYIMGPMKVGSNGAADFSIFYTGARILQFGWRHELYDLNVQARFHSAYYRARPLPYNHPAYELLIFLPLANSSFTVQYFVWLSINLIMLLAVAILLSNSGDQPLLRKWVFVLSAALAFPPIAICLLQGQDAVLLILIYSLTYLSLKRRQDFLAGLLFSLALFKFQLVLPFLIPLLLRKYWKFLQGFISGASIVLAISILMTGWSGFLKYLELLRLLTRRPEVGYMTPGLMANLRGLMAAVFPDVPSNLPTVILSVVAISIAAWMMVPPSTRDHRFDLAFALNVTSVVLVSYHLYLHDLSLVFIAVLVGANALSIAKSKILFWCAVVPLFCLPIYALALAHAAVAFVAIEIILLWTALIVMLSRTNDQLVREAQT